MTLSRRSFLATTALPLAAQKSSRAPTVTPPNILFILADDLAAWMLGCYGNREIRTPNIDQLARGGTRFSQHFVATPICSASRATFFTGRLPRQHGIHDFLTPNPIEQPPQGQAAPPPSFAREVMISDLLAARGYNCGYVGKWHMGDDTRPGHGFQFTYTMAGGSRGYTDPEMFRNGEKVSEKGYLADLMTRQALSFLDQQAPDKPFFLSIGYLNPHTPYAGHPQKYYDLYAESKFDTFGWQPAAPNALREKDLLKDTVGNIRKCAASVTALDDQIPLLMAKLTEKRLRDNTLIVFSGDNGFLLGRHGLWSKGLASDPINMYEEVVQVPLIWNWPGRVPVEGARPELVSAYDLLPSLCDAVGIETPARNLCGRSYLKLAQGFTLEKKEAWRSVVFGHFRNTEMARDQRYKAVVRNNGEGPNELFDLRLDPNERTNQYENPAFLTVRDRLTRELDQWRKGYSS